MENSRTALYAISLPAGSVREILSMDDVRFSSRTSIYAIGTPCSVGRDIAVCIYEEPTTPPQLAVIDLKSGTRQTLVDLNPEFQNIKLSPATRLEWKNKYGDVAFGHLVKPLNYVPGTRYPLVITSYRSRGFLRGATGDEYPIQVFAANGFAVLSFDRPRNYFPGEGKKMSFDVAKLESYTFLTSLEVAVDMLDRMGTIDRTRVGLCGLSNGSTNTQFAISHSDYFRAAAVSGASFDPIYYYLGGIRRQANRLGAQLGFPEGKDAANWREISPALNGGRVKAPLLIQAADTEFTLAIQAYTALQEHGKPVEMIIYPDEGHMKMQPKHRYYVYQRNVDWFNFWLNGREDPNPKKAEQYQRWRKLRELYEADLKAAHAKDQSKTVLTTQKN